MAGWIDRLRERVDRCQHARVDVLRIRRCPVRQVNTHRRVDGTEKALARRGSHRVDGHALLQLCQRLGKGERVHDPATRSRRVGDEADVDGLHVKHMPGTLTLCTCSLDDGGPKIHPCHGSGEIVKWGP